MWISQDLLDVYHEPDGLHMISYMSHNHLTQDDSHEQGGEDNTEVCPASAMYAA